MLRSLDAHAAKHERPARPRPGDGRRACGLPDSCGPLPRRQQGRLRRRRALLRRRIDRAGRGLRGRRAHRGRGKAPRRPDGPPRDRVLRHGGSPCAPRHRDAVLPDRRQRRRLVHRRRNASDWWSDPRALCDSALPAPGRGQGAAPPDIAADADRRPGDKRLRGAVPRAGRPGAAERSGPSAPRARPRVLRAARVPCVPDVPADPPACRPPGRRRDRLARRRAAAGDAPDLHGARLVARSRLRARRDRPRRRAGGPRSPPLGSVKTARRRPRDRRARPLRGGIPRLARPCAHSLPRGEGRLHRGAHTPRRAPGRPGRRGARPLACPAPRARDGRARPSRLHGSCSEDEALGILASEAGTKRDRRCVAVLVEIVAAGPELALEALAV